jgi:Zn-dependent alcohol dehydrogenase
MNIPATVVPVRSAPFEIETLELTAPFADEVFLAVVASGMCHDHRQARQGRVLCQASGGKQVRS